MKNSIFFFLLCFLGTMSFFACNQATPPTENENTEPSEPITIVRPNTPTWAKNATIYEVNLRQFTPEGTIKAFESHIPRLKDLGIDLLWFMPIHPISVKNRKGMLGSPYAVADYKGVNPEFGTMAEFKSMVQKIHDAGMYLIIDWVPNHTGWDNPWITQNPEWFTQDSLGNIIDPIDPGTGKSWGWTDVADLNYDNEEMQLAMINAMKFWIEEVGVDGFRCDVAHNVPVDFWKRATDSLYQIQPVFMLAEAEVPAIRNDGSFVMDYGWGFHHLMNEIARGDKNALYIDSFFIENREKYTQGYHMHFTSNHDENSWSGTEFKRMGEGHLTFAVLTATFDGMPLIYTGQESAMDKQLAFFEKDTVEWGTYKYTDFYRTLFNLKHQNKALWNGKDGGDLERISTGKDESVFAFQRKKGDDTVIVILNLSDDPQAIKLLGSSYIGEYNNVFAKGTTTLSEDMMMNLNPWDYVVLSNK